MDAFTFILATDEPLSPKPLPPPVDPVRRTNIVRAWLKGLRKKQGAK